ncbi:hypothetical protein D2E64_27315 [Mycobacteroides abscessus]|nr:hypothetical protein BST18_00670 [Mycobacteroides abscessus subsp. bolletii]PVA13524.1 hypothetical protein DDJ61_20700 [Mycobacteroides abscessus]BBB43018.1 hypothetical protein MASB_35840 [Mycobacteroides abscessus subsp. bolletii BD]PVA94142.1 hypothetical protein DDJ76_02175 [Mycobacteroides abscessus]RIR85082.1 hypothetical protein D2E50_19645 [Mycobacteroides abscessus]
MLRVPAVGVEFDGAQHWTDSAQCAKDIERYAELQSLGWPGGAVKGHSKTYPSRSGVPTCHLDVKGAPAEVGGGTLYVR